MAKLSSCIFQWDQEDYDHLMAAKRGELVRAGMRDPSATAVRKAISKDELACHCRRQTREATKTKELLGELLQRAKQMTDGHSVPLLKEEVDDIWEEQRKHV